MFENKFIVAITYSTVSDNYFIDFSDENGYIVSTRINENVAKALAAALKIKITQ